MPTVRIDSKDRKEPEDEEAFYRLRWQMDEEMRFRITPTTVRCPEALRETLYRMRFSANPSKVKGQVLNDFMPEMLCEQAKEPETS